MIEITLGHYLVLASIIFVIGVAGIFLNRKNVVVILLSIVIVLKVFLLLIVLIVILL